RGGGVPWSVVVHGHTGAFGGEGTADRPADPAASTGDQDSAMCEARIDHRLSLIDTAVRDNRVSHGAPRRQPPRCQRVLTDGALRVPPSRPSPPLAPLVRPPRSSSDGTVQGDRPRAATAPRLRTGRAGRYRGARRLTVGGPGRLGAAGWRHVAGL